MNSIITGYYPVFEMYQDLRNQLMDLLDDQNLNYRLPGDNPTLGALCREMGEVEHAYIESFKTYEMHWDYRNEEPGLESSVEKLSAWYAELDEELRETIEDLSEDDIENRMVDRGGGFKLAPLIQLEVYKEALLIFYGKAWTYLHALGKPLPEQWQNWIG